MSWWGKLVGGALGLAIGGPLGALVGAALGHGFDQRAQSDAAVGTDAERAQTVFFTAAFSVMGHLAKADGRVTRDEIALAERVMQRMQLDPGLNRFARELFRRGKQPGFALDEVLSQLRREIRSRDLLRMFVEIQVFAAYADGVVHPTERTILERIRVALDLDAASLAQIETLVRAELEHEFSDPRRARSAPLADAYALLGVAPDCSDEALKRAYRRAMSQHHPDKLVSKGLPEEMIRLATAKTQEIKAAYQFVRDARAAR